MTYDEIAARLGVQVCGGVIGCNVEALKPHAHEHGWADLRGRIHWHDRQVRRHGLYRFLKLVVSVKLGTQQMRGGPLRMWMEAAGAYDLGLSLGVRFSRDILAEDRTLVRSWMPTHGRDLDETTRRKIARWAR